MTRLPGSRSFIHATVSRPAGESGDAGSGDHCRDPQETSRRRKVDRRGSPGARHLPGHGSQGVAQREGGARHDRSGRQPRPKPDGCTHALEVELVANKERNKRNKLTLTAILAPALQ